MSDDEGYSESYVEKLEAEKLELAKHVDGCVRVAAEALAEVERLKAQHAEDELLMRTASAGMQMAKAEIQRLKAHNAELLGLCVRTRQIYGIEIRDEFGLIDAAIGGKPPSREKWQEAPCPYTPTGICLANCASACLCQNGTSGGKTWSAVT